MRQRVYISLLLFVTLFAANCYGQDAYGWFPPQVTQPVQRTVCYICMLSDFHPKAIIGFPSSEPEQTLEFEVINLAGDPFFPKKIRVNVNAGKYVYGFFDSGKTYVVVAEKIPGTGRPMRFGTSISYCCIDYIDSPPCIETPGLYNAISIVGAR